MKRIGPQLAAAEIAASDSGLTIHTTVQVRPGVDLRLAVRQSRLRSGEREPGGGRVGVYAGGRSDWARAVARAVRPGVSRNRAPADCE